MIDQKAIFKQKYQKNTQIHFSNGKMDSQLTERFQQSFADLKQYRAFLLCQFQGICNVKPI